MVDGFPSPVCGFGVINEIDPSLSWSAKVAFSVSITWDIGTCSQPVPLFKIMTESVSFGVKKSISPSPSKSPMTESTVRLRNFSMLLLSCCVPVSYVTSVASFQASETIIIV